MEPKLHNDYKLEEAANWLTHHTGERWSVNAVLSALLEIHLITVGVVLHVGAELTELCNTENKHILSQPMQLFVTTPVESFIEGVLLAGCAIPPGLTGKQNNHRYRVSKPIFAADIRLDMRTVEELLPPFVPLVRLMNDGKFPKLRQGMEERAERDAVQALKQSVGSEKPKPLQRTAAQDAAILFEIKAQGFEPRELPKNPSGKPGVKAAIRGSLKTNKLFIGKTIFDKAWERLTANGEIAIKG